MRHYPAAVAGILLAALLSGCQPAPNSDAAETVRPVLTKTMVLESVAADRFAGEVVARYKTALGFRVLGRVTSRSVEVGDRVEPGQQIAQLDSAEQELALRTAEASVTSTQGQLNTLLAIEQRQRILLSQSSVSSAVFESAQQARRAGEASLAQAKAQLSKALEQLGYTTLRAETAGVVTTVEVEPGQTVAAGATVITVVQPEVREAVIAVIESDARNLHVGDAFTIAKQLNSGLSVSGTVREVSPQADSATRTVTVRITMNDPTGKFRLGSTITATPKGGDRQELVVPATSVFLDATGSNVWVVDTAKDIVARRPVVAEQQDTGAFVVSQGLAVGELVVTAGIHSLAEGQKVRSSQGHAN